MRRPTTLLGLLCGILVAGSGCGAATAVALPALIITNTWSVEGDAQRSFSFQSDNDGEVEGSFTGNESVGFDVENPLTGTWGNGRIRFTVQGNRNGALYQGDFQDLPDRITVSSAGETLVLVRQVN